MSVNLMRDDLMGGDFGLAEIHKLYCCHDRLLEPGSSSP